MKNLFIIMMTIATATSAQANEFGLLGGFKFNSADSKASGSSITSTNSFDIGGLGNIDMDNGFAIRMGFIYAQRYLQVKSNAVNGTFDLNYSYLDIPVGLKYQFSDFGSVFGGMTLALLQSKNCTLANGLNCSPSGEQNTLTPFHVGMQFKISPLLGGEIYYEFTSGKIIDNVENYRSVGAHAIIFFE